MVDNSQEYRLKYWATRLSVRSHCSLVRLLRTARFARALHLFAHFAHFAHSLARGTVNDWMDILSLFFSIFDHSEATSPNFLKPLFTGGGEGVEKGDGVSGKVIEKTKKSSL